VVELGLVGKTIHQVDERSVADVLALQRVTGVIERFFDKSLSS
jgi:hypothetical protein